MRKIFAFASLLTVLAVSPVRSTEGPAPFFRDAFLKASPMEDDPSVVRSRSVTADLSELLPGAGRSALKSALRLSLNLFPDVAFTAALEARTAPDQPYVAWRGYLEGVPDSVVTFVASRGQIAGLVRTLEKVYRIRFLGAGHPDVYAVEELDTSLLEDEAEPIRVDPSSLGPDPGVAPAKSVDDGTLVDVLVVYTPAARAAAGGREAMENQVALAIDETNVILERSRVIPRVRLVRAEEVAYVEDLQDMTEDLFRLQRKGDRILETVHTLRNTYKADTVALIRKGGAGACGVGFLLGDDGPPSRSFEPWEFSVTALHCLAGSTLPHEMGHNWGCNHAREDPIGQGAYDYSFGYKSPDSTFRTIMAYDCPGGCARVLNYSNPEIAVSGRPTGTAENNNALSLNNVRSIISNFRLSNPTGAKACKGKVGKFAGCSTGAGGACSVCAEKLVDYPLYFFNHPSCNVNFACPRKYTKCNAACPAPTAADACNPTPGQWQGCGANACAVCASVEAEFPSYFRNHPACTRDVACGGGRSVCNAACPAPGEADR